MVSTLDSGVKGLPSALPCESGHIAALVSAASCAVKIYLTLFCSFYIYFSSFYVVSTKQSLKRRHNLFFLILKTKALLYTSKMGFGRNISPRNKLFLVVLKLLTDLGWREIADAYVREFPGPNRPCDRDCSTQWARQLRNDPNKVLLESGQRLGAAEHQDVVRFLNLYAQNHLNQRGLAFMATGLATQPAPAPVSPSVPAPAPPSAPATATAPSTTPAAPPTPSAQPISTTVVPPPPISVPNPAPNPQQLQQQLSTSNIAFPQSHGLGFGDNVGVAPGGAPSMGSNQADDENAQERGFVSFLEALESDDIDMLLRFAEEEQAPYN